MKSLWQRKSFIFVILLIVILIVISQFTLSQSNTLSSSELKEVSNFDDGATVFAGDTLINTNNLKKFPIICNINYLQSQFYENDYVGCILSILTGTVPIPSTELVSGNVTDNGKVADFKGPGYVEIKNNTLFVHTPKQFIWGFNDAYTVAVKTDDGIDIQNKRTNETIKHIKAEDISNDTIDKEYLVPGDTIKNWYGTAKLGAAYTLEWAVAGINDGRHYISPDELRKNFPEAYEYSCKYPSNSPVMLYATNYTLDTVSETSTSLGSHPQYNDNNRAYNAKQFVKAWNGTVIPPHTSACGKEGIAFSAVPEPGSQSGAAAHGVCPPARTLRNTVMALGISLPVGMDTGENAVLFDYHPSTGIRITNSLDYPIKLFMWTSGEGTGMTISSAAKGYISTI